jgi:phospholipase C
MSTRVLVFVLIALSLLTSGVAGLRSSRSRIPLSQRIKHIIVLMEENRSFDHLMGWFNKSKNGPTGAEYNLVNASNASSPKVFASPSAVYINDCDPNHDLPPTTFKIFGPEAYKSNNLTTPRMSGFVEWERDEDGNSAPDLEYCNVMEGFLPEQLPVLSALVDDFTFFDKFFASVPGPTFPNRLFFLAATSAGQTETIPWYKDVVGQLYPVKTIFDQVGEAGGSWKYYYADSPWELFIESLAHQPEKCFTMDTFFEDAAQGTLPNFAFINPRMGINMTTLLGSNDMHPDHDVRLSELLYKQIYEALRASPQWEETLFILTFDEHGGFWDHVTPPQPIPAPGGDDQPSYPDTFGFDRAGIRIPTILASPWLPKGFVISDPPAAQKPADDSIYELTSIMATVRKLLDFMNGTEPLTKRDAWAATFEHVFDILDEPRTDCPMTLPDAVPPATFAPPANGVWDPKDHRAPYNAHAEAARPVNHLQEFIMTVNSHLAGVEFPHHIKEQREVSEWAQRHFHVHREKTLRWKESKAPELQNVTVKLADYETPELSCYWNWYRNDSLVNYQTLVVTYNDTDYCLDSGAGTEGAPIGFSFCYPSKYPAGNRDRAQHWIPSPNNGIRWAGNRNLCVTTHYLPDLNGTITLERCSDSVEQHFGFMGDAPGMTGGNSVGLGTHRMWLGMGRLCLAQV